MGGKILNAAKTHPEAVACLRQVVTIVSEEVFIVLAQVTYEDWRAHGWNALMLAVRYHPTAVPAFLEVINALEPAKKHAILAQVTRRGNNALMLAAQYHPDVAVLIRQAMNEVMPKPTTSPTSSLTNLSKGEIGFINQLFHDLTSYNCNAVSGSRELLNIEVTVTLERLGVVSDLLGGIGATVKPASNQITSKITVNITNVCYSDLVTLSQQSKTVSDSSTTSPDESGLAASSGSTAVTTQPHEEVPLTKVQQAPASTLFKPQRPEDEVDKRPLRGL